MNEQARSGNEEQEIAGRAQKSAMVAKAGPGKSTAFESEEKRDVVAVEVSGDGQSEKSDGEAEIKESREIGARGSGIGEESCDSQVAGGEKKEDKSEQGAVDGPEQDIEGR